MTSQWQRLDPEEHLTHGWHPPENYSFATGQATAPLVIAEVPAALPFFPLAIELGEQNAHQLVAVQGLHAGENLFLDANSRWHGGYIPSFYRAFGFALDTADNAVGLRVDRGSGFYRESPNSTNDLRFFDDDGQVQDWLKRFREFLHNRERNAALTQAAVDQLIKAGVLARWTLKIENSDPARPLVQGLYRVDEGALRSVTRTTLQALRDSHALGLAYAQLFSMGRVALLQKLEARRTMRSRPVAEDWSSFLPGAEDGLQFVWGDDE